MPKINNLQRRGQTYYIRVRVPTHLLDAYRPKKEICYSLGTTDFDMARKRVRHELVKIQSDFDEKTRQEKAAAKDADMLSKYAAHELEGLVLRWLSEAEKKAKTASIKKAAWLKKENLEEDDLEAEAVEATLKDDAGRTLDEVKGVSGESIHYGQTAAAKFLKERGVTFNPKSAAFKKLGNMFSKATYAAAHHHLREWKGLPFTPTDPVFAKHMTGAGYSASDIAPDKRRTLQQVMDEYMSDPEQHKGASTRRNYTIVYRLLKELLGAETYVHDITREDVKNIRNILLKSPANAAKLAQGKTLEEASKLAAEKGWALVSKSTVNSHLNKLNALLNFSEREGYIQKNHAKGLSVKEDTKKKDKRHGFKLEQLEKMFSAPIYTGCKDDGRGYSKVGTAKPRNARFWIPVIALFTGMRLNEICQLHTEDIAVEDGVDVILITMEDAADGGDSEKRVKTKAGVRYVPIHPELKKIGFMAFAERAKKAGQKRLFPELKLSAEGYFSVEMSKWFGRFLDSLGITGKGYVFHSFRHTFRDALRIAEISRDAALQLGGWAADSVDEDYGDGLPADVLFQNLSKVGYKGLDLSHLYLPEKHEKN